MVQTGASDKRPSSVQFLLAEYQSHKESFWKSEELGERRVNFFITLVTAVLTALAIREKGIIDSCGKVSSIFLYGCVASFIFGWVTLIRLVRRNLVSHKELRAVGRIRAYFTIMDPEISKHLLYESRDDVPQRDKKWSELITLGNGGLVETVSVINSFLVAAFCGLYSLSEGWSHPLGMGILAGIAAWIGQFIYVKCRYFRGKPGEKDINFPLPSG